MFVIRRVMPTVEEGRASVVEKNTDTVLLQPSFQCVRERKHRHFLVSQNPVLLLGLLKAPGR